MTRTTTTTAQRGVKTRRDRKSKNATHARMGRWIWGGATTHTMPSRMSSADARERKEKDWKEAWAVFRSNNQTTRKAKEGRGIQEDPRHTLMKQASKQASKADQHERLTLGLLCLLFFCLVLPCVACLPRLEKTEESTTSANPVRHPIHQSVHTRLCTTDYHTLQTNPTTRLLLTPCATPRAARCSQQQQPPPYPLPPRLAPPWPWPAPPAAAAPAGPCAGCGALKERGEEIKTRTRWVKKKESISPHPHTAM